MRKEEVGEEEEVEVMLVMVYRRRGIGGTRGQQSRIGGRRGAGKKSINSNQLVWRKKGERKANVR